MIRIGWLLAVAASLVACGESPTPTKRSNPLEPPAFWVWQRSSDLDEDERKALRSAGVRLLAWQVAEARWSDDSWQVAPIAAELPQIDDVAVAPVFRLAGAAEFLGSEGSAAALAKVVRQWRGDVPAPAEIQLDFECPDNLLTDYAGFLRRFRKEIEPSKLSVTAFPRWPRAIGFRPLTEAVDGLSPKFYDRGPPDPAAVAAGEFPPLVGERTLAAIDAWAGCPVPWRAGLPNFERLSLWNNDGSQAGEPRDWTHDELAVHPALEPLASADGVTVWRVTAEATLGGIELKPGQRLVHRRPSLPVLRKMQAAADAAGATSLIFFALPGPEFAASFSVTELTAERGAQPDE